jgi:hypothetical protein
MIVEFEGCLLRSPECSYANYKAAALVMTYGLQREQRALCNSKPLPFPPFHRLILCAPTGAVAMFIWKPGTWSQRNVTITQVQP